MKKNDHEISILACPYANASLARNHTLVRATAICVIMENIAYMFSLNQREYYRSHQELRDLVFRQTSYRRNKMNIASVDTAILNMVTLGYLSKQGEIYTALEPIIEAYRSQSFQNQCANLYQAEASRKIALNAIIIAVVTMLTTYFGVILPYIK